MVAAWNDGIRYFDRAPFCGSDLPEIRMGIVLKDEPRDDYVISTKVDRIILDKIEESARDNGEKRDVLPNKVVRSYSADGTLRSM